MLDTKPAAEPLAVPQIVCHLIDHLPQPQRADLNGRRKYIDAEFYSGRDGWLVVRMRDWDPHDVFFKWEMNQLQYQCNCWDFRTLAPVPCAHVVLAALKAVKKDELQQPQSLPAVGKYPPIGLKPLVATRPVAGISEDGAICLLRQNGQPVLRSKKLSLPWKPYFEMLRSSPQAVAAPEPWLAGRELLYVIDSKASFDGNGLILETMFRERKKDGQWRKPAPLALSTTMIETLSAADQDLVGRLVGCAAVKMYGY